MFLDKYSGINSKLALKVALGKQTATLVNNNSDAGSQNQDDEPVVGVYLKAFSSGVNDLLKVYK
jgi:hypothetical protein